MAKKTFLKISSGQKSVRSRASDQPGAVWVRKRRKWNDKEEFILVIRDERGLRFKGYDGLFSFDHFEPK